MFRTIALAALPLALGACQSPQPEHLTDVAPIIAPADSSASAPPVLVPRVVTGYTHRTPVEPSGWRELNDRQAPARGGS